MAKKDKKWIMDESGDLLYDNDNVRAWREADGTLYFESNDPILREIFMSNDYSESVAALMRLPKVFNDEDFWKLKIINKYDMSTKKSLYWLTGGNSEWNEKKHYNYSWDEVDLIFNHEFEDTILNIIDKSNTLGDIKRGFMKHINLPTIYEFSLNNGLIG